MSRNKQSALIVTALVVLASALTAVRAQQGDHVETPRDQWQRVPDIVAALGAASGANIADVGAGHGYFTTRLAKAVGPAGRVFAVDVNPVSLRELRETLGSDYPNVDVVRGDEDNPHLPEATLDGILVVNAYHEFAEYRAMLGHLQRALKPGGRLVLIEPIPRAADATRSAQTKRHAIAIDLAEGELKEAGFDILQRDVAFVSRPGHVNDAGRATGTDNATDWLLVARRAADPAGR
jgi:SAM-dependent methyltransferase